MIGTIRKHSTWLWMIIIVGTIISFVWFLSPDAQYGVLSKNKSAVGFINGRPISNSEYLDALTEAKLRFFFRWGSFPDRAESARFNFVPEDEANGRLLMLEKVKDLNVQVGIESTLQFRDELLSMMTGSQTFDSQKALEAFDQQVLKPNGLTLGDFERFVRHEVGIMHLVEMAGLAGRLVTPQEAEQIYRREHEDVVAELVVFGSTNHFGSVTNFTEAALSLFYTNRMAEYRLPERVEVAYVRFEMSNFLAQAEEHLNQVTNLTAAVNGIYSSQAPDFFKDDDDKPLSEETAKAKIKKQLLENEALRFSRKKAYDFVNLFDETPILAELESLASSNQMPVKVSAAFNQEDGPEELKVPERFTKLAFDLKEPGQVSLSPITGEEGTYVIALKRRLPSELQSLEAVREQVVQQYRQSQAVEMARLMGKLFHSTLTNGLAAKRSFTEICLERSRQPVILPPFSRSTTSLTNLPSNVSLMEVKRLAFNLEPGTASGFMPNSDGGLIVFLRNRFPVDEAKMKAALPEFLTNLRQMRQGEAANEWFSRQRQLIQADLPRASREQSRPPQGS